MIRRDGYCTSLWQDAVEPLTGTDRVPEEKYFDVIVVGGGITGITTAFLLQQAGKKVLVLEAANVGFGTTGGTTAHLNTLLDIPYKVIEKKFNLEASKLVANATAAAIQLIHENIARAGIDAGFSYADAVLFAQEEKENEELESIAEASKNAGLTLTYTKDTGLPIPFTEAIRVSDQAKFNPLLYVHGLAKSFMSKGGVILENCRVTKTESVLPADVYVETEHGTFASADLVYATHIPPGINLLHLRCAPYRSYAMAVTLNDNAYPEVLAYDMKDPYHYYRTQEVNGQRYLIAGGKDHKTGTVENTEHSLLELEAHVRKYFDVGEVAYKWSSQYFEPADGLPYIGLLPGNTEHIYTATGFGGNGMVYSHVAARVLTNLITGVQSPFAELFSPSRIKPVAGFKNFISHNAAVAGELLHKLVSPEKLTELSDLAPNEGKVIKFEKEKLALYKDEAGELRAFHPGCRHMQCDVKWNNAERSWDCPCHGARYDAAGTVVTGPADSDLKMVELGKLISKAE